MNAADHEAQVLVEERVGENPFGVTIAQLTKMFDTETDSNLKELNQLGGVSQLFIDLRSDDREGLTTKCPELTARRIAAFGDNQVRPPKLKNFFLFMYKQTTDFCIRILALASFMMFLLATVSADPFESIVQALSILIAILAVVIIGAITDYRKEQQFIALYMEQEELNKKYFTVIRDSRRWYQTPHTDILVGDLVDIQPGDSLTFDGILLRGSANVEVDESMITGLSQTIKKRPQGADGDCFMRAGSNIFEGYGTMLVCAVGDNTYSNRQKQAQTVEEDTHGHGDDSSPLQKSTTILAKYLVFIGCMSATFMFVILELYMVREINDLHERFFTGRTLRKILSDFIDAFLIIVLSIPEGLPLIVTLSLAYSINQLKKQGIIVRNLHVCQVLGGMDTMCFDKTGTLTKNNTVLSHLYTDMLIHDTNDSSDPLDANWALFRAIAEGIISNNTAKAGKDQSSSQIVVEQQQNQDPKWQGNRMDCALMEFLDVRLQRDFVMEYQAALKKNTTKLISTNESKNNYTAAIIKGRGSSHRVYIKGRPQDILDKCRDMAVKQPREGFVQDVVLFEPGNEYQPQKVSTQAIDEQTREDISSIIKNFQEQSLKTIGLAYRDINENDDWDRLLFENNDYVFLGVTGMRDEIRGDAAETVRTLQEACIDIKMITGDVRLTAVNVGKHLMMVTPEEAQHEILRKSEILQQSRLLHDETKQPLLKKQLQSKTEIPPGPLQYQLQENVNLSLKRQPVVLNFQEYLIKVREILKASERIYQHTVITEKNCIQLISEIREDTFALEKIRALNKEVSIVADASQEQKQNFIRMLIGLNDSTIGYVGDGNNDARSLKTSHVGFAPGTTATNVAKECSGVILLDDKLSGIGPCIRWGRNIFLNIKRFIYFQMSFYFTSIMTMLVATIAYQQQPFSVLQVIWLALVQDIFSAISLSTERPQKTVLAITRPFRQNENLIDSYLVMIIACQFLYQGMVTIILLFFTPVIFGVEPSQLHAINEIGSEFNPSYAVHFTIVYHVTALFQVVNLINARRIGPYEYNTLEDVLANRPFLYMIALLILVENLIIYEGGKYFKTAPLTFTQNAVCCVLALGALVAFWVSKYFFSAQYFRRPRNQ